MCHLLATQPMICYSGIIDAPTITYIFISAYRGPPSPTLTSELQQDDCYPLDGYAKRAAGRLHPRGLNVRDAVEERRTEYLAEFWIT